jgi:gliding motility-associated-like protein
MCGAGNQTVETDANECTYTHSGTAWDASASDNCGNTSVAYTLSGVTTGEGTSLSGISFNVGTTQVLWTVTDTHGNTATCIAIIVVQDVQDPVVLNCPNQANLNFETDQGTCTYTASDDALDPSYSDNCTIFSAGCTLIGATTGNYATLNGVTFNTGVTYVNWTFSDLSGNTATCSYSVTVTDQELPEFLTCPGNITFNTLPGECGRTIQWTVPEVEDNCQYTLSTNIEPGTYFSTGSTQVIYTATDASGNQSNCSFTVTVTDVEPPAFSCLPDISSCNPNITYPTPQATDNCGIANIYLKYGPASGSIFPVGTTQVTYEAVDIHGNSSLCTFEVVVHPAPSAYIVATDITCHGYGNGIANLQVTGSAPFTFEWNTGQTGEDLFNLNSGLYGVTITDYFGCTTSTQTTIQEPTAILLSSSIQHVNCHDGNDGSIDLSVSGGAGGYSFYWSDGQNSQNADSLSAGNYTVVVTDSKGCAASLSASIYQPDTLWIELTSVPAICAANNGTMYSQVTGGTPPYSYEWSNGQTGSVLNEAASGNYILTLTDGNECIVQQIGNIGSENNLDLTLSTVNVSCNGLSDATARIIAEQAQAPYQISWSNGDTGVASDSLSAGSYTVEFTDANGCSDSLVVTISEPDSLNAFVTSSSTIAGYAVSENGSCDGWIEVVPDGGTADYTYLWSNGSTGNYTSGLCAGAYGVVITDANGCTISRTVSLTEPLALDMPNAFSPNGDGDNDAFEVHGLDAYPDNDIVIFNRWGNVVFEKEGYQNDWKGENNQSEPLPDATYFVILKVNLMDGGNVTLTGYIDLRRN